MRIRLINEEDLEEYLELLSQLTTVGNIINSKDVLKRISNQNIYIFVSIIDEKVVGCASLLIEQKFIHSGRTVGHIEDVVVHNNYRKKGIGRDLIDTCVNAAKTFNCYKVILDCDENNIPFYQKCNFKKKGVCMRLDL